MLATRAISGETGPDNDTGGMVDSTSSPCVPRALMLVLALVAVLAVLAVPGVAGAQAPDDQPPPEQRGGRAATAAAAPDDDGAAALSLTVAPVVGEGPEDGDLVEDPGTGLPTLTFSPTSPSPQTAVLDFTVTNTGQVPLHDVGITHDRIGTVLDPASGTTLAPGASTTVRAAATFTFEEATTGTAGIVVTDARATATDEGGAPVTATDESTIQVVAVLPTPAAAVDLEAIVGAGGLVAGAEGVPTLSWSAQEAAVGDERTIHYRLTITNTGPVELVDVTAVVDVLGTRLAATDAATTLAPGESTVVELSRTLTPDELGGDPAEGVEVRALADVHATDGSGQAATATDDVVVLGMVAGFEQPQEQEETLPAAGPPRASSGLLAVAVAMVLLGTGLLAVSRRRTVAAAPPGRPRPTVSRRPG